MKKFLTGLLLVALAACAAPAYAQIVCDDYTNVIESLANDYGEQAIGFGFSNDETEIFQLFYSSETRSWSILKTTTNGVTCIMAVGQNWELIIPPNTKGSPS